MTEFLPGLDLPELQALLLAWGWRLLVALLIFLVGRWVAKRISLLVSGAVQRAGGDPMLSGFVGTFAFGLALAVVIVAALDKLGVPSASLLAALGAAGLAIGLALQGSLANLASGLLLILTRPFKVGDFVELGGRSGTVDKVGLLFTRLVSGDNREITVPNREVMGGAIINVTARGTRRIDLVIGIDYAANPARAQELIRQVLQADERILAEPEPRLMVLELGESSVDIAVRPWCSVADYWPLRSDLLERIKAALEADGIEIPFPQRTVHLRGEAAAGA